MDTHFAHGYIPGIVGTHLAHGYIPGTVGNHLAHWYIPGTVGTHLTHGTSNIQWVLTLLMVHLTYSWYSLYQWVCPLCSGYLGSEHLAHGYI